jgi:hypothetical protein
MKKGDSIAPVDVGDLKIVWQIRAAAPIGCSIDSIIYERACKPNTDVIAAAHRVAILSMAIQMRPEDFQQFLVNNQPCDVLFQAFAQVPLAMGMPVEIGELLRNLR